jgi:16S rRNA U1498 N3-methylase RsmE
MKIFTKLFYRRQKTVEDILNMGLSMAMEFGANWLQPINKRLGNKLKDLSPAKLDEYNVICQAAMKQGHNYVYDKLNDLAECNRTIPNTALQEQFNTHMKLHFNWISNKNLKHLYSQSCYYAWKNGLDKIITD